MRRALCSVVAAMVLLAGCAGQAAKPVSVTMPGDQDLNCGALQIAIVEVDKAIEGKEQERLTKGGYNAIMFVGGFFLFVPWFFMDLKNSQEMEKDALQQRRAHLRTLAAQKDCEFIRDEVKASGSKL